MNWVLSILVVGACFLFAKGTLLDFGDQSSSRPDPWFCHGLDCPKYRIINTQEGYETRNYRASVWVATHVETYAYAMASSTGFKRLFSYIEGENEDNVKVPMTAPVVTRIKASAGPFCKSNFTVAFFVPFDFQEDPPQPSNPGVFIFKAPPFTAHVAQSGGFVFDDWTVSKMAKRLAEDLDSQGEVYDEDAFMLAGYDPPFRLQNRHTEVWFVDTSSSEQPDNENGDVLNVM